jgi:hypothetical protein
MIAFAATLVNRSAAFLCRARREKNWRAPVEACALQSNAGAARAFCKNVIWTITLKINYDVAVTRL